VFQTDDRSNQAQLLPLDAKSIEEALELNASFFKRSHEILYSLLHERQAFETFATWLTIMAEDVFAHPDSTADPPPLHTIDTEKVAAYISDHLEIPILNQFSSDFLDSVPGTENYLAWVRRLSEKVNDYFRHAARELKAGVAWALPDWIDLQINDEIVASDAKLVNDVYLRLMFPYNRMEGS
jgi:Anaphase-promoting complex, cyclosome, subunit 4